MSSSPNDGCEKERRREKQQTQKPNREQQQHQRRKTSLTSPSGSSVTSLHHLQTCSVVDRLRRVITDVEDGSAAQRYTQTYGVRPGIALPSHTIVPPPEDISKADLHPAVAEQLTRCPPLRLYPMRKYRHVLRLGRGAYGETWLVEAMRVPDVVLRQQQEKQQQQVDALRRKSIAAAAAPSSSAGASKRLSSSGASMRNSRVSSQHASSNRLGASTPLTPLQRQQQEAKAETARPAASSSQGFGGDQDDNSYNSSGASSPATSHRSRSPATAAPAAAAPAAAAAAAHSDGKMATSKPARKGISFEASATNSSASSSATAGASLGRDGAAPAHQRHHHQQQQQQQQVARARILHCGCSSGMLRDFNLSSIVCADQNPCMPARPNSVPVCRRHSSLITSPTTSRQLSRGASGSNAILLKRLQQSATSHNNRKSSASLSKPFSIGSADGGDLGTTTAPSANSSETGSNHNNDASSSRRPSPSNSSPQSSGSVAAVVSPSSANNTAPSQQYHRFRPDVLRAPFRQHVPVVGAISELAATAPIRLKNGYEIQPSDAFVCKIINAESSSFAQVANEVNILSNIAHPCIVAFQEGYVEPGRMNLLMEYVDGGDLRKEIDERRSSGSSSQQGGGGGSAAAAILGGGINQMRRFPPEQAVLALGVQLCLAMEYLHRNNILHRDLKPDNIILSKKWIVKLADFGLAKVVGRDVAVGTGPASFVGTPGYVPPEVWERRGFTEKSDMFGVGCIMYELITLERAYPAVSPQHNKRGGGGAAAAMNDPPKELVQGTYKQIQRPEISAALRDLVYALLSPDPEKRPSALEILKMPIMLKAARDFLRNYERGAVPGTVDAVWAETLRDQMMEIVESGPEIRTSADFRKMQVNSVRCSRAIVAQWQRSVAGAGTTTTTLNSITAPGTAVPPPSNQQLQQQEQKRNQRGQL